MSYIAMYRKYRPQNFRDMVGQEHITKILKNQINSSKISHAYIFSGTRGTGKTTAAKIFARAINCLNPKDGEPCNECEACRSILDGNTTDIVEMDAASNNSVENIRNIRQEVAYSTTGLKYKVYIIDEAHMLSTSAFNALLKTLEEPPENVVFILATTEEHKIIPTILSRCIRFEFKKIGREDIIRRLDYVLKEYNVDYDIEALEHIATLADGGMRDALSILERLITSSNGKLTEKVIEEVIGTVSTELIESLAYAILSYNVIEVEKIINEILDTGKDVRNILNSLLDIFLSLLVIKSGGECKKLNKDFNDVLLNVGITRLHQIIKGLSKLDDDIRQSNNVGIIFKARILDLTINTNSFEEEKLLSKIEELELKIEKLQNQEVILSKMDSVKKAEAKPEEKPKNVENAKSNIEKPVKEAKLAEVKLEKKELKELKQIMQRAVESDNLKLYSALAGVKAYKEEDAIKFTTENSFAYEILNKENTREDLKKIVSDEFQKEFNIKIEYIKEEKKQEQGSAFEKMIQDSGIPFEIVD